MGYCIAAQIIMAIGLMVLCIGVGLGYLFNAAVKALYVLDTSDSSTKPDAKELPESTAEDSAEATDA